MPDSSKSTEQLVLIGLSAGLIAALWELSVQTHGLHAIFGIAAAGVLAACGMAWRRSSPELGLLTAVPFVLLAMIGVSWTGTSSLSFSSGLCWTACMTCLLAGLGTMFTKRPGPAESVQVRGQQQLPARSVVESTLNPDLTGSGSLLDGDIGLLNFQNTEKTADQLEAAVTQTLQAWTRVRSAGEDRLEGTLVVDLEAGQKQCYVHLPFQPFFHGNQTGYCECDDDCFQAEFDVVQTYGARLNVRRRGDVSTPGRTEVTLVITSQFSASRAA